MKEKLSIDSINRAIYKSLLITCETRFFDDEIGLVNSNFMTMG